MQHVRIWLAIVIGGLALGLRLFGLGSFMTADEPNWMVRSSQYYHNFLKGDLGGTFMTTHPGVTAMWLIGAGEAVQEARLGFHVDTSNLQYFRVAATLPVAVSTAVLVGVVVWLMARLLGFWPAVSGGALLALDPYLTGMSQIAHLDALLALCMAVAALGFLVYLKHGEIRYALLAGIFTGLALGTKLLPALWLLVFFALVLIVQRRDIVRRLAFVGGVAVLTFYCIWPALWFGTDLDRSFKRDIPSVITQEHVVSEESDEPIAPATFYVRTVLGRTTPFVLILSIGAVMTAGMVGWRFKKVPIPFWLVVYGLGYVALITLVAKKADRYALPALVVWPVVAGWAGAVVLQRLHGHWRWGALGAVTVALLVLLSGWTPYAIAYDTPLWDVRPLPQQGWGEGLDAAAAWLNQNPLGDRLTIASWYPSVMAPYFRGKTMSLSSRNDKRVGYVVLYRNMEGRARDTIASDVLDEFKNKEPVYVVDIMGTPYVWIYETLGTAYFPKRVHELIGTDEVGQTIPVAPAEWSSVELGMANYSGRPNNRDVVLTIREQPGGPAIRTVTINAREIGDDWQKFHFERIADSEGKSYFVSLTSPTSVPGNAVTVRYVDKDVLVGDMYQNGELKAGWDIAYRLTD